MVNNIQYPHRLKATFNGTEPIRDGNGDWITTGAPVVMDNLPCRIQPNNKGQVISGVDGNKVVFDSIIYVQGRIETVPRLAKIEVFEEDELILSIVLLRFSRDSFHSRLWV